MYKQNRDFSEPFNAGYLLSFILTLWGIYYRFLYFLWDTLGSLQSFLRLSLLIECRMFYCRSSDKLLTSLFFDLLRPDRLAQWLACHSSPGGCEFDTPLRRTFFPAYFCLSPLQKYARKVVGVFGKKSCVSTGERKPGNMCIANRHNDLSC